MRVSEVVERGSVLTVRFYTNGVYDVPVEFLRELGVSFAGDLPRVESCGVLLNKVVSVDFVSELLGLSEQYITPESIVDYYMIVKNQNIKYYIFKDKITEFRCIAYIAGDDFPEEVVMERNDKQEGVLKDGKGNTIPEDKVLFTYFDDGDMRSGVTYDFRIKHFVLGFILEAEKCELSLDRLLRRSNLYRHIITVDEEFSEYCRRETNKGKML